MAELMKPWVTRRVDAQGRRVKKGTPGAILKRERTKKWYGRGIPGLPPKKRVPLASDKRVAQQMLAELVTKGERGEAGLPDLDRLRLPLASHLTTFAEYMRTRTSKPASPKQVRLKVGRIRRLLDGCGFKTPSDLAAEGAALKVSRWLASLKEDGHTTAMPAGVELFTRDELASFLGCKPWNIGPLVARHGLEATGNGRTRRYPRATAEALLARARQGAGQQTANHYLDAVKSFCRWLVREKVIGTNPLDDLARGEVESDQRRARRALTADELALFLSATADSKRTFRGLSGNDRWALYLTAVGTGFRAGELASLTPALFRLDDAPPTVALARKVSKNRRGATQPLPGELADILREHLRGRPAEAPVWPGTWHERGADMVRADLAEAGLPAVVRDADGDLFHDLHALRHAYVALLERSGVSLKHASELARHRTVDLTAKRYGRAQLEELGASVDRLSLPTGRAESVPSESPLAALSREELESLVVGLAAVVGVLTDPRLHRPDANAAG